MCDESRLISCGSNVLMYAIISITMNKDRRVVISNAASDGVLPNDI